MLHTVRDGILMIGLALPPLDARVLLATLASPLPERVSGHRVSAEATHSPEGAMRLRGIAQAAARGSTGAASSVDADGFA
jgi:hypothetical protein